MNRHGSLNRIYRLVWSQVINSWVAVAENVKGRGKGKNTARKLVASALALSAVTWLMPEAIAGPVSVSGVSKLLSGPASVTQSGSVTTITQSTQLALLNWNGFNVPAGQTVDFTYKKPGVNFVSVDLISGNNGSNILGTLNAPNGEIFLINPNGIYFGKGAQVNVAGLVASALGTTGTDSSGMHFSGTGSVVNHGTITAGSHVVLLGSSVTNDGSISTAPLGTIILGAGNNATLSLNNSQVSLKIDGSTVQNLISNGGLIQTDGGTIILTAGAASKLMSSVVNTGVIEARTVGTNNGTISLLADMQSGAVTVGGTLDASAPNGGDGGAITTNASQVHVADGAKVTTLATNGKTGSWIIDPPDFTVAPSGGDETGAQLTTALTQNNVTLTSGQGTKNMYGNGNININDVVSWSTNTLTLQAQANINVTQPMYVTGSAALSMQFGLANVNANNPGSLNVYAPININTTNPLAYTAQQGSDGALINYTVINSLGAQTDANSSTPPPVPTLQSMATNTEGNFVLGSNIDASGTSSWNGGAGFTPIGNPTSSNFTGQLDGLGHTISNLFVSQPGASNMGLFGMIGYNYSVNNSGVVRNLTLSGANIAGSNQVGALAGAISGGAVVSNVNIVGGSISGNNMVGGLVGLNAGNINNSSSSAYVAGYGSVGGLAGSITIGTVNNSSSTGLVSGYQDVGGLVGLSNDLITNSYAAGVVKGTEHVGGLVGQLVYGTINNSYSTSYTSGQDKVGGLVGYSPQGTIADSYSLGSVSGSTYVSGLVGYATNSHISYTYTASPVNGPTNTSDPNYGAYDGAIGGGGNNTVTSSYWNSTINPQFGPNDTLTALGNIGLTTNEMQSASSFANFNFVTAPVPGNTGNNWVMVNSDGSLAANGSATGNGATYPMLASEYSTNITNAHQLQLMALALNADYTVTNNINAYNTNTAGGNPDVWSIQSSTPSPTQSGFVPVGSTQAPFTGTLDGLGNAIISLTSTFPQYNVGLIGVIGSTGTVKNITLANANISGAADVGALAGANYGTISNSSANGTVSGNTVVGGLAGLNNSGTIVNSSSGGTVSGTGRGTDIGGLVGYSQSGTLSGDSSSATVSGIRYIGGMIGFSTQDTISACSASGAVTQVGTKGGGNGGGLIGSSLGSSISDSHASGLVTGDGNDIGGLVGSSELSVFNNSSSSSNVVSTSTGNYDIGGLIGYSAGDQIDSIDPTSATGTIGLIGTAGSCFATGNVTANGAYNVGGLVGLSAISTRNGPVATTISNSYATGAVSGSSNVGGLAGQNYGYISNSSATGSVTGNRFVGGLFGVDIPSSTVTSSFATGNVSGSYGVGGLAGFVYGLVQNSSAAGNVSAINVAGQPGANLIGGLAGSNLGTIDSSYAIGNVGGVDYQQNGFSYGQGIVGGLVGQNIGVISRSFAAGSVSGSSYVGGLAGVNSGSISDSYATGNVNASGIYITSNRIISLQASGIQPYAIGNFSLSQDAGGLVGFNTSTITRTYATGAVTADPTTQNLGPLVGLNNMKGGSVTESYWNSDNNQWALSNLAPASSAGSPLTYAQMQMPSSFPADWNIATPSNAGTGTTWFMYPGEGTPLLIPLMTPLTLAPDSESSTYNGNAFTGGNITLPANVNMATVNSPALGLYLSGTPTFSYTDSYGNPVAPVHAGFYNINAAGYYSNQLGYLITYQSSNLNIRPALLSLSSIGQPSDKTYDGTTTVSIGPDVINNSGEFGSDVGNLSVTSTGTFGTANVGNNAVSIQYTLTATGNTEATDYTLGRGVVPSTLYANINPATITVAVPVFTKTYDGTTTVPVSQYPTSMSITSGGLPGGQLFTNVSNGNGTTQDSLNLTFTPNSFAYTDPNAGTGNKTVNGYGLTVNDGNNGLNYNVIETPNTTSTINKMGLTVSIQGPVVKSYDGTTIVPNSLINPVFIGAGPLNSNDTLSGGTFAYAGKGSTGTTTKELVDVTGLVLNGSDAGNYTLTDQNAPGQITPKGTTIVPIYVTGSTVAAKTYDGTTTASIKGGSVQAGFGLALSQTGNFDFSDVSLDSLGNVLPVGVTATDTLSGTYAGNFKLIEPTGLSANINPRAVTVSGIKGTNIVYNDTFSDPLVITTTSGVPTINNLVGTQTLGVINDQFGSLASRDVSSSDSVTTGLVLVNGTGLASDYKLTQPKLTVSVKPEPILVSATINTKTYDGLTTATGTPFQVMGQTNSGTLYNGDQIANGPNTTYTFSSANAGTRAVTIAGLTTTGDVGDYSFVEQTTKPTGVIRPIQLYYTANGDSATTAAGLQPFSGQVTGNFACPLGLGNCQTLANQTSGTSNPHDVITWTVSPAIPKSGNQTGYYALVGSGIKFNTGNYTIVNFPSNAKAVCINEPGPCPGPTAQNAEQIRPMEPGLVNDSALPAAADTSVQIRSLLEAQPADSETQKPKLRGVQVKDGGVKLPDEVVAMN